MRNRFVGCPLILIRLNGMKISAVDVYNIKPLTLRINLEKHNEVQSSFNNFQEAVLVRRIESTPAPFSRTQCHATISCETPIIA